MVSKVYFWAKWNTFFFNDSPFHADCGQVKDGRYGRQHLYEAWDLAEGESAGPHSREPWHGLVRHAQQEEYDVGDGEAD